MKRKEKVLILLVLVFLVLATLLIASGAISIITGHAIKETSLISCLNEKGVELYYRPGCPACQTQKKILGNSFEEINSFNCDVDSEACRAVEIKYIPTWRLNGANDAGVKTLEQLKEFASC